MDKDTITAEQFEKAVGSPPAQDDLERVNCNLAGRAFHWDCGWCVSKNLPNFMLLPGDRDNA